MRHLIKFRTIFVSAVLLSLSTAKSFAGVSMPANLPGEWTSIGRITIKTLGDSAVIQGGFAVEKQTWADSEMSLRMRAPAGTEQVQLWAGFRCRDRDSRYVFALRGGGNNDIYLARYAPDGGAKFLGFAPLNFHPVPGVWYRLRVVAIGNRIQIYLNDEQLPRINVVDSDAPWTEGSVLVGGGWLPAEYADLQVKSLSAEAKSAALALGDRTWTPPAVDKEALRKQQRAAYAAAAVSEFGPQRAEISLNGDWLFMPDYQLAQDENPVATDYADTNWHVMEVPRFWTPGLSWLHGETGFPYLKGVATTKGVADSLYVEETRRVESYTFDWHKTKAAWYREYIELPDNLQGRHFELTFDAIAKVSEIWANGIKVGTHTGMFGEIKCDVTKALKPGRNVIAVHVVSDMNTKVESAEKVEGVAVTVEVTSKMLRSLPHGMFQDDVGGIWQPVKLTVSAPVLVKDLFVQPGLHGADVDVEISNTGDQKAKPEVGYTITLVEDGTILYSDDAAQSVELASGETKQLRVTTPKLNPKLWSPREPNLYRLEVRLKTDGKITDRYTTRFGFRTFTVDGGKFLLNGRPYWLRGANPFPNTLRPNDAEVAHKFMEIAREGNVAVTRSHIVPFTKTWLDAADEVGIAVSYEGTWPWLMLNGEPPSADLLKVWKEEFLSLIREHRNHPSLILWTVNNEMKFHIFDADNPDLLKRKWIILDDMIRAMRKTDPTRPIVADSGYDRKESAKSYRTMVEPYGFDDGDVDDAHRYFGWYNESFFHFYDGQYGKKLSTPGRPFINQEMSTGYPRSDDGHPTRFYLFKHYTPQALVGDDAYENADPAIFLQRQAFMTKELAETIRRTSRDSAAGVLHFSYFTWLQRSWDVNGMKPLPAYYALQKALQPVLVSAELYGRHFYSGSKIRRRVCIINDSENYEATPAGKVVWEFRNGDNVLSQGTVKVPSVAYYHNRWLDVDFDVPSDLPTPRVNAQLVLQLASGEEVLSQNSYDVVLATEEWANGGKRSSVALIDPRNRVAKSLSGIAIADSASLDTVNSNAVLVIGDAEKVLSGAADAEKLKTFVAGGGKVFLLNARATLAKLFPEQVKDYVAKKGEIVTMGIPESPVFSGIEPLDLAWFEPGKRQLPVACTGVYQIAAPRADTIALAQQCDIHAYLQTPEEITKYNGTPLVEIRVGKGRLVACEMDFEAAEDDPIARRLLGNIVRYLASTPTEYLADKKQ